MARWFLDVPHRLPIAPPRVSSDSNNWISRDSRYTLKVQALPFARFDFCGVRVELRNRSPANNTKECHGKG